MSTDTNAVIEPFPLDEIRNALVDALNGMAAARDRGTESDLLGAVCVAVHLCIDLVGTTGVVVDRLREKVRLLELVNDRRDDYEMEQRERNS